MKVDSSLQYATLRWLKLIVEGGGPEDVYSSIHKGVGYVCAQFGDNVCCFTKNRWWQHKNGGR